MRAEHHLKTHPEPFAAVARDDKPFEYRIDDGRNFKVGDLLILEEWRPDATETEPAGYTGRKLERGVSYIARDAFGIPPGYVVMGLAREPVAISEWCRLKHVQACHICERVECGDNTTEARRTLDSLRVDMDNIYAIASQHSEVG